LFTGSRGLVWIGTQGGGLNRLDPDTEEIRVYTVQDGLPHDHVEGIIEDDFGYIWITTNDGITRFDPNSEEFWVLKAASGLTGNRFFANAVHKNRRGELFFGGESGLTILDPARLQPSSRPPPVALTDFQIHGRAASLARALGPPQLDLEPNENFFTFRFAALDYTDPAQNRYRYRLENLDEEWIDAGPNRTANYTSVPPGRYVFRVAARSADGVWNEDGLAISLRVQTPYYATWWFRSAIGVTVLMLITGFYAYRLRELHRRQRLRLDIAGGLHDDIGGNLATIIRKTARVEKAIEPNEKVRAELGRVGSLARETEFKVREAVWTVKEEYDTAQALVTRIRDTAEMMLGGSLEYRFRAPDHLPDRRVPWDTRRDVYLLVKEALNNILKHAEATSVDIEIEYDAPHLTLWVSDDGKGFDLDGQSEGHGVGLMREHAARYGGEDPVRSTPGVGTTVQTRIRIG
jgi:two-component sensor histidine kinase